jgi:molybdopterin converting factor small subunit
MARVLVPAALAAWTGGQHSVDVGDARTVRDVLTALDRAHPGVAARVLDASAQLQPFLRIFVGQRDVASLAGLDTPVGERDEIAIVAAIAGGAA